MLKLYSISNDFFNQTVNPTRLSEEIEANETIVTNLDYINTDGDDCKIYFDGDLSQDEVTALDTIVSNHDGQLYDFKAVQSKACIANINYNFLGLHKEETIDDKGCLVTVNMYKNYDGETFSDLAIKDEYVYYFNAQDLVTHRNETITWYKEDGSVGVTKQIIKYYNLNDAIKEGVKRRQNLVDKAKAYGLATIEGTHESGLPNSYYWFSTMLNEVALYLSGTRVPSLNLCKSLIHSLSSAFASSFESPNIL